MKKFDVTIIGAGLAGLQCARLLARRGIKVLLIDKKSTLDQKVHTTGIFVRRTLEDFDIPEDCLGPVVRHVSLYSPKHRVLNLESRHDEFRVGRMGQLYLRYLTQCLLSGVEWTPSTSYQSTTFDRDSSTVTIARGSNQETIKTRFLIGGDGVCSRVARDLQLDLNSEWIVGVENVYEDLQLNGPPRLLCFLDPKLAPGYIAWIAYDGEQAHVGVGGYSERFDPLASLDQFQQKVSDIAPLTGAKLIERRGGRIPVGGVLRNIANSHGLLIGDAAGAVSPLTAGGLDPCMRLSTLASDVTFNYLNTNDPTTLDAYNGSVFRSRFTSRLWARRISTKLNSTQLAELSCAVLRLPLFQKLAAHVFFGRGSFPDVESPSVELVSVDRCQKRGT